MKAIFAPTMVHFLLNLEMCAKSKFMISSVFGFTAERLGTVFVLDLISILSASLGGMAAVSCFVTFFLSGKLSETRSKRDLCLIKSKEQKKIVIIIPSYLCLWEFLPQTESKTQLKS